MSDDEYHAFCMANPDLRCERNGRGKPFGATVAFMLPTRAAMSPDAARVSNGRLRQLSKEERRKFLPVCPEFVIEVMSPTDRQEKDAGVDACRSPHIYRTGQEDSETRTGILKIAGDGPVAGFELDLSEIWGKACSPSLAGP